MKQIRILIVDDQRLFTDSLKRVILAEQKDIKVSVAADGTEALSVIGRWMPDVILMDVHMPIMNGIEAVRIIHGKYPSIKIVMLTAFGYDEYVRAALENGAIGYLLKDISSMELLAAIHGACSGARIISPGALEGISRLPSLKEKTPETPDWYRELTGRERDILLLVMKGYSNEEIADKIFLSQQTVKNYLSSIYSKLRVKNRFQAMRLAMEHKMDALHIYTPELGPKAKKDL